MIDIPIRYYRDYAGAYDYGYETLGLPLEMRAACRRRRWHFTQPDDRRDDRPCPARRLRQRMRVAYVHNDLRLVANRGNIVGEVWGRTKGISGDALAGWRNNAAFEPEYLDCVKPRDDEPNFPKWIWSGFHDTFLDQYLRCGIRTPLPWATADAPALPPARSGRTQLPRYPLRDCSNAPGEIEMPDTLDDSLPGGWISASRCATEHLIGYTTTRDEFVAACQGAD